MRVTMICNFAGGGITRSAHDLARGLARNPDVHVTMLMPRGRTPDTEPFKTKSVLPAYGPNRTILRRAKFATAQIYAPSRVLLHAAKTRPDVVHFQDFYHLLAPGYMRALGRQALVLSVHDVRRGKALLGHRVDERCLIAAYRRADSLVVHSDLQRSELLAFAGVEPDRVALIPLPFEATIGRSGKDPAQTRAELGISESATLGLFVGSIRDDKNLDALLEAIAINRPMGLRLLVAGPEVGRHKGYAHYEAKVRSLALDEVVRFRPGRMTELDLTALMEAGDALMLPYLSTFTSQSDFVGRAASARLPIVCSDAPTLSSTVRRFRLGVAAGGSDPIALAKALGEFLSGVVVPVGPDFDRYLDEHSASEAAAHTLRLYEKATARSAQRLER